jgi:hypothetical protein
MIFGKLPKFPLSRLILAFMRLTPAWGPMRGARVSDLDSGVIRYSFHRLWENLFLEIFVLLWITATFFKM